MPMNRTVPVTSEMEMAVEGTSLGVSQPEDDLAGVNSMLSTADKLFLVFVGNVLKGCLQDEDGISITPSNDLQLKFDGWLKMHGVKADDSKEHSVDAIIHSIWTTSRDFFVYLSIEACNTELARDEMEKQIKAEKISLEYQKQDCGTKAFTQRQVQLMHILAIRNAF